MSSLDNLARDCAQIRRDFFEPGNSVRGQVFPSVDALVAAVPPKSEAWTHVLREDPFNGGFTVVELRMKGYDHCFGFYGYQCPSCDAVVGGAPVVKPYDTRKNLAGAIGYAVICSNCTELLGDSMLGRS